LLAMRSLGKRISFGAIPGEGSNFWASG
jgi:hypothetical protein